MASALEEAQAKVVTAESGARESLQALRAALSANVEVKDLFETWYANEREVTDARRLSKEAREKERDATVFRIAALIVVGLLVFGVWFYFGVVGLPATGSDLGSVAAPAASASSVPTVAPALDPGAAWGVRGDAVAPFTALFSAAALFAALFAVFLQGRELALQREELRETRDEMTEQRKQFERTAKAQEALAESQAKLAGEQQEANRLTWFMELAQRRANLATFQQILAQIELEGYSVAIQKSYSQASDDLRRKMGGTIEECSEAVATESKRIIFLERRLGLNAHATAEDVAGDDLSKAGEA